MTDKEQIETLYREMYQAMVKKDTATLNRMLAVRFDFEHLTGKEAIELVRQRSV